MEFIVAMTTTATAADAQRIADALVTRRLAACVQVVGPIRSVYRWQDRVELAEEFRCEIKTVSRHFEAIRQLMGEIHGYDLPELIATPITHISPAYGQWLAEQIEVEGHAAT